MKILEPPPGCMEIPGYILVVAPGKKWITQEGGITTNFRERGLWATQEEAEIFKSNFAA